MNRIVNRVQVSRPIYRTQSIKTHYHRIVPRAMLDWNTLNTEAYYIGKGVILFTMFYCGLNWAMYRDARKHNDKDKRD